MSKRHVDTDHALKVAFVSAARTGQTDVVQVLLDAGVDVHAQDDLALRMAALSGQTEMVRLLLEHGADVHAKGATAFLVADENGHKATATLLKQWMRKRSR